MSLHEHLLAELLTPELEQSDFEGSVEKFGKRYFDYYNAGFAISLPDNPMGNLRFTSTEVLEFLEAPCERVVVHLNSFHRKQDFDQMLETADRLGVQYLLCISGDGNPKLHRLEPEELGLEPTPMGAATSVELLQYIRREYPNRFQCGVAFNPYEQPDIELMKLEKKMEVGFDFIGTQLYLPNGLVPGFDYHTPMEALTKCNKPVVFGIWTPSHTVGDVSEKAMHRLSVFLECISPYYEPPVVDALKEKLMADGYDAEQMIGELQNQFSSSLPGLSFYFSMPILKKMQEWQQRGVL